MKRVLSGFFAFVLLSTFGMAAVPARASADVTTDGFNIITSPLPIKLSTTPGSTVTADLRVKNLGNDPETLRTGLMKFGATGELGQPNLFDLTPQDTYASWVHFSPSQFVAQPNVWNTVKMTINVPKDASLGYYLAATFSRVSQGTKAGSTNYKGSVATLVLLNVNGPAEKRSLQLSDFTTDHGLYEYLPVNFNVKIHNNGNIYLAPTGNIFILKGNKPVTTVTFNESGGSVLPNSNRVLKVKWDSGFPVYKDRIVNGKPIVDKHAVPEQDLKWDFTQISKLRIGKYTAKLLVVYDDGNEDVPLESSVSFWVLPWKILLGLLLVLLVIGFGIFSLVRSIVRGTRRKVGKRRQHDKKA